MCGRCALTTRRYRRTGAEGYMVDPQTTAITGVGLGTLIVSLRIILIRPIDRLEDRMDQRFDHLVDEVSKTNRVVTALANHRYAAGSAA